jgi:hypothetical protein
MTAQTPESQPQVAQNTDKEINFRKLEAKYQAELERERSARIEAEKKIQQQLPQNDEEIDSEPFVDHKKLNKTLAKFGQNTQTDIQKAMETAKQMAKEELKQEMWLEQNPDFYNVLEQHSEKLAIKSPRLANSILRMPEGFERQKLVYENIKELGLDKPAPKTSTIQDKIDANKRSPYYQPSSVGAAPYASAGDFSANGQKQAYDKMQELKKNLRI